MKVHFSDISLIQMFAIQMPTVCSLSDPVVVGLVTVSILFVLFILYYSKRFIFITSLILIANFLCVTKFEFFAGKGVFHLVP